MKRLLLWALLTGTASCAAQPSSCYTTTAQLNAIVMQPPAGVQVDPTLALVLNIPAYRLDVLRAGDVRASYTVAVGEPKYPTRPGEFYLESITWNPWWIPPESDWARAEKRTPPGPGNPMGKVKLNYSPFYYLHGTPDSLRLQRAASHGCVRMRNSDAVDLALMIQDFTRTAPQREVQDRLLSSWNETRSFSLPRVVSLSVRYELAEVRDSFVFLYADIYSQSDGDRAGVVRRALLQAGIDSLEIDSGAVAGFARRSARINEIRLDSLLRVE
ncbi:MAG TPA: L,D-transpeptidase [Longimicrobiales bacterium]|nr:L,D-transpeptidase [Longimicrobiales bacterium]